MVSIRDSRMLEADGYGWVWKGMNGKEWVRSEKFREW